MNNEIPKPYKPERHPKGWGFEDWIANGEYCGKLLFFEKGKRKSIARCGFFIPHYVLIK